MRWVSTRAGASGLVLGALLLGLPVPAWGESPDPVESATTVEQIAEQLERDPVFVQEMVGGGDVEATRELVRNTIEDLPYPVYVVAGRLPVADGGAGGEDLGTLAFELRRRLGGDAVFALASTRAGEDVIPLGKGLPEPPRNYDDWSKVADEMLRQFPNDFRPKTGSGNERSRVRMTSVGELLIGLEGLGGGSISAERARDLAGRRYLHIVTADPDDAEPPTVGKRWMVGSLVGLLVFVWSPMVLRLLTRKRPERKQVERKPLEKAPASEVDWSVDAARLESRREQLSRTLARLDQRRVVHPELIEAALTAKEAADTCAESSAQRDRLGALTLAERGLQAARHADDRRPYEPWRPCFLNPLHGRAKTERQWVLDDAEIQVPMCLACARRQDKAEPAQPLMIRHGRRTVPYFHVADVWGRTGYGALIDDYAEVVLRERGR